MTNPRIFQFRAAIVIATTFLGVTQPARGEQGDGRQVGILIVPFEDSSGVTHGRSGDLVRYSDSPRSSTGWDIEFEGVLYPQVWDGRLIPFDSSFAPVYVWSVLNNDKAIYRGTEREMTYDRADLAERARSLFAYHPYRDHFAAFHCGAVMRKEGQETEGKGGWPNTVACTDAYLRDFPKGMHRDELEWLGVQMRNATYEYEGDPGGPIGEARTFEAYLASRPRHAMRDEIELRLARLWSLAYEMIMIADEPPSASKKTEAGRYRARADSLYTRLAARPDPAVSSKAFIARFNLRNGRRIYANPNAW
jgi:hypothetical protein